LNVKIHEIRLMRAFVTYTGMSKVVYGNKGAH